jgi:hypothetical protein
MECCKLVCKYLILDQAAGAGICHFDIHFGVLVSIECG